jgi:chloramphenicol-sensitive protein RarD
LLLYAESTKKLPLTVLGFLQYIAPTLMLILGVFVYREPFDSISLIAFGLIWIGLAFFSYSQYRLLKRKK